MWPTSAAYVSFYPREMKASSSKPQKDIVWEYYSFQLRLGTHQHNQHLGDRKGSLQIATIERHRDVLQIITKSMMMRRRSLERSISGLMKMTMRSLENMVTLETTAILLLLLSKMEWSWGPLCILLISLEENHLPDDHFPHLYLQIRAIDYNSNGLLITEHTLGDVNAHYCKFLSPKDVSLKFMLHMVENLNDYLLELFEQSWLL